MGTCDEVLQQVGGASPYTLPILPAHNTHTYLLPSFSFYSFLTAWALSLARAAVPPPEWNPNHSPASSP